MNSLFQPTDQTTAAKTSRLSQKTGTTSEDLEQARGSLERAQKALKDGDWEGFGRAMGELQDALGQPTYRQDNSQDVDVD